MTKSSLSIDNPYYIYDEKVYDKKESVLDAVILKGDYDANIELKFGDHIFRKLDWTQDFAVDIGVLYKIRAKQLREKYEYLSLAFSGGSDSTQILLTFLNNKIHLDEIQIVCFEKLISKISEGQIALNPEIQALLEYKYAALPMLERVRKESPNTKISILDASDYALEAFKKDKNPMIFGEKHTELPVIANHRVYSLMPYVYLLFMYRHMMLNLPNKKIGYIRGFEKPILYFSKNQLCFSFSDMTIYGRVEPYISKFSIEDFYWSVDAPLIPIKQSHMIKKELETNRQFLALFYQSKQKIKAHTDPYSNSPAIMVERELSRIIYPDWNTNTYAAGKVINRPPELAVIELFDGQTNTNKIIRDFGSSKEQKFRMLSNQDQVKKQMLTKPYIIGPINLEKFL
jgi:hypothetical protein